MRWNKKLMKIVCGLNITENFCDTLHVCGDGMAPRRCIRNDISLFYVRYWKKSVFSTFTIFTLRDIHYTYCTSEIIAVCFYTAVRRIMKEMWWLVRSPIVKIVCRAGKSIRIAIILCQFVASSQDPWYKLSNAKVKFAVVAADNDFLDQSSELLNFSNTSISLVEEIFKQKMLTYSAEFGIWCEKR